MTATHVNHQGTGRRRAIGPLGTTARVLVGGLLVGSVTWGHLTRGFHLSIWLLGLVGFPTLLVAGQWLRARRIPTPLRATGPAAHALNVAVFVVLYLLGPTSDAASLTSPGHGMTAVTTFVHCPPMRELCHTSPGATKSSSCARAGVLIHGVRMCAASRRMA